MMQNLTFVLLVVRHVAEALGEVLGVSVETGAKMTAFVKCAGNCDKAKQNYEYEGVTNCLEASLLVGRGS